MKYSKFTPMQFIKLAKNTFFCSLFIFFQCFAQNIIGSLNNNSNENKASVITGAEQTQLYFPLLKNKKVAVVSNATGVIRKNESYVHIIDSMLCAKIQVVKVFAPEHGFRSNIDAGTSINHQTDKKTQLPIISLYGKNKKPTPEQLENTDVVIFDIQDVGVRFYTYISTLHYVMEACAEQNIPIIVLDRPNPNGHYIDGPILKPEFKSFIGMHPVPIVYGMTIGEYAKMINGEKWLKNGICADLKVIPLKNYNHCLKISLLVKPSPNLPNEKAINLYPSLCFFEGTQVSVGRGTPFPFQIFGSADLPYTGFYFTPKSVEGASNPIWKNTQCNGVNLENTAYLSEINLQWLIQSYHQITQNGKTFFLNSGKFFNLLAGNNTLKTQIETGVSEEKIKESWQKDLKSFEKIRKKYLIYPL